MSQFAERRAVLCRRAIRAAGVGTPADVWRLAEWLGACLTIEHRHGIQPLYIQRRDGGARIQLPVLTDDRAEALILGEEIGHFLWRAGYPGRPSVNPYLADRKALSLDDLREQDEEHEAQRFLDAFLLPWEVLAACRSDADAWDLLEESVADRETFLRRLAQVQSAGPVEFARPEPWSAWSHYRVEHIPSPTMARIRVSPRAGPGGCIEWPVRDERELESLRLQMYRDLAALRPQEVELRFEGERRGPARDLEYHWAEFESLCRRRQP